MTTLTAPTPSSPRMPYKATQPQVGGRALMADVLRSEWTKIRTVRSTFWTLVAAAVAMVGLSAIVSAVIVSQWDTMKPSDKLLFNATDISLSGPFLAQLAIGVLGVLVITSEYSTGMIRATFAAVPQRPMVLAAKAVVFTAVSFVVGVVSSFIAFFVGQAILGTYSKQHLSVSIGDPNVIRSVLGAGVFLAAMGLLGLSIGAILRRSAGAISALFGLIFFLPGILELLPSSIKDHVNKFLPSNAGSAIYRQIKDPQLLSPGMGALVLFAYAVIFLGVATWMVKRRDA